MLNRGLTHASHDCIVFIKLLGHKILQWNHTKWNPSLKGQPLAPTCVCIQDTYNTIVTKTVFSTQFKDTPDRLMN